MRSSRDDFISGLVQTVGYKNTGYLGKQCDVAFLAVYRIQGVPQELVLCPGGSGLVEG